MGQMSNFCGIHAGYKAKQRLEQADKVVAQEVAQMAAHLWCARSAACADILDSWERYSIEDFPLCYVSGWLYLPLLDIQFSKG